MTLLPAAIETPRLRLRPWRAADAEAFGAVMASIHGFLARWMVWALDEPSPPPVTRDRLAMFGQRFADGREWIFAIESREPTDPRASEIPAPHLLGGIGAHPRDNDGRVDWDSTRGVPGTIEIGYWLREEATGRGFCTEAVTALIDALRRLGVARIEIRTHPENHPSRAIPRRLGCRTERVLPGALRMPGGGVGPAEVWVAPVARTGDRVRD